MSKMTLPAGSVALPTSRARQRKPAAPTWWIIFTRELLEMWIGGKALVLLFIYSVILGLLSYVLASNNELDLIPSEEMVFLILQTALLVGGFIAAIIGADSISGERERATLEALLITPGSRTQIVVGKLLAALTPWPAAMLTTLPYLHALAQDEEIFVRALLLGFLFGTLLTLAYTGIGLLASIWSASNRTSLGISLLIFILCALPVQFPGNTQTGVMGRMLKALNPMEAVDHVIEKLLVNNRTLDELTTFLVSPVLLPLLVLGILLFFAAPRLRLDAGIPWSFRRQRGKRRASTVVAILLVSFMGLAGTSVAQATVATVAPAQEDEDVVQLPLEITVDTTTAVVDTGEPVFFQTTVKNQGDEESPSLILAMNIINLDEEGDVVDPEDWAPERTQYLEELEPGETVDIPWEVNPILGGDYMIYMVLIPTPETEDASSWPITSAGIHITVDAVVSVNPGGITPYAVGMPLTLLSMIVGITWYRRRQIHIDE